jgi:hypothetical protein
MPKFLSTIELKRGEFAFHFTHGLLALKWYDKKDVHMLSSKHTSVEITDMGKEEDIEEMREDHVWKLECH